MSGNPKPLAITAACFKKPLEITETLGIPWRSTAAAARNTAGVQAPHAPIALITASTLCWRSN
jgi:hypothetical protein